jgi:hypothetical protein
MPAVYARTATQALINATLPFMAPFLGSTRAQETPAGFCLIEVLRVLEVNPNRETSGGGRAGLSPLALNGHNWPGTLPPRWRANVYH